MTKTTTPAAYCEFLANSGLPAEIRPLFEWAPLLTYEDPKKYFALLAEFAKEVGVIDTIEWFWVKDMTDLTWEIIRWRLIKTALINANTGSVIFVAGIQDGDDLSDLSEEEIQDCATGVSVKDEVVDSELVAAKSFVRQAASIESIERLQAAAEIRRNNALREIDARRMRLGRAQRQASDRFINNESPLVPSAQVSVREQ